LGVAMADNNLTPNPSRAGKGDQKLAQASAFVAVGIVAIVSRRDLAGDSCDQWAGVPV